MEIKIQIQITGTYSDGQPFHSYPETIENAIAELEMIEVNEHIYDNEPTYYDIDGNLKQR